MLKIRTLLFITLFSIINAFGQQKYDNYWIELLNNNRKKAWQDFLKEHKSYKNNIDDLLTHEILRNENGYVGGPSESFIDKFITFDDYEYYMYALWNKTFLFDNYIETEFHKTNTENILKIADKAVVENNSIKNSLTYLKAIAKRSYKKHDDYKTIVARIPTIRNWQFCGVFENMNSSGIDIDYEPESYAKNDKLFNANSNGKVGWYKPNEYYKSEPYQFFTNHSEYGTGVDYAQTFVKSDKDQRVQLRIANSSAFKLWVNDALVYKNLYDVNTDLDAYTVTVNLSKGYNRILIKNAETGSFSYFAVRICDEKGNPIPGITSSENYQAYSKKTVLEVKPVKETNSIEQFFINKVSQNPNKFLYKYCLILTYLRNQKYEKAKIILKPLQEEFKKSSMLRILESLSSSYEGNYVKLKEINRNIINDDPKYYFSYLSKVVDTQEMNRMDITAVETFAKELKEAMPNYSLGADLSDMLIQAKRQNLLKMKEVVDRMMKSHDDKLYMMQRMLPLYGQLFNDQVALTKKTENLLKKRYSPAIESSLLYYYEKANKKNDVVKILAKGVEEYPGDNLYVIKIVGKLQAYKKYKESLPYIDILLKNYPYSFRAMEYKGEALMQMGKEKEALEYFEKSLFHNSGNTRLQKKIADLKKEENLIKKFEQKDIEDYISKYRDKNTTNNHGVNVLLDENIVQLYENGSLTRKTTYIYEVTSPSGVENFKEYDLGLSGNYHIIKSEVIKKDKTVKPAQRSGSQFVFNGLAVGDIILIEYETNSTGSGRFYLDYTDTYQFNYSSYCFKSRYVLIIPKKMKFNYTVENGKLNYSKKAIEKYDVHQWELPNPVELPKSESYMPTSVDYATMLHLSTINSWSDIAVWYSDLVRSQLKLNPEAKAVFKTIFPENNLSKLSDEEKSRRIYDYIMNNFNYSHVSFKQSGFIPQKPSKTISSKLGDCKDFSTLYTAFAKEAGLQSNLILVATSNYGDKNLILPSQDFNHCIVKVNIDNKDCFLELTDKNLPYKALPNNLNNAIALEIPYQNDGKQYDVFKIKDTSGIVSENNSNITIEVKDNSLDVDVESQYKGSVASYYFDTLTKDKYEQIKESISKDFVNRTGEAVVIDTIANINLDRKNGVASYKTKLHIDSRVNKVGSMSIFKLPAFSNAYNKDIISHPDRKYAIYYPSYENNDVYRSSYIIKLPEGKKFVEIPEAKTFSYKKHTYKLSSESLADNKLKIIIEAKPSKENITPEEYQDFKAFVNDVLKTKEIILGYK